MMVTKACVAITVCLSAALACSGVIISEKHTANGKIKGPKNHFEGKWNYQSQWLSFDVDLSQRRDSINGTFCAATQRKIDCWDSGGDFSIINGVVAGDTAKVIFNSNYLASDSTDNAEILYNIRDSTLLWVRKTHKILSYVPDTAVLTREK